MQTFSSQVILLYNPISPRIVQKRKLKLRNRIGTTRDTYNFFTAKRKCLKITLCIDWSLILKMKYWKFILLFIFFFFYMIFEINSLSFKKCFPETNNKMFFFFFLLTFNLLLSQSFRSFFLSHFFVSSILALPFPLRLLHPFFLFPFFHFTLSDNRFLVSSRHSSVFNFNFKLKYRANIF